MKHTMLRIVAVLAVIACVAMGFAGCNKGGDDKLVIGCSGPLTGDAAQYGVSVHYFDGTEISSAVFSTHLTPQLRR